MTAAHPKSLLIFHEITDIIEVNKLSLEKEVYYDFQY